MQSVYSNWAIHAHQCFLLLVIMRALFFLWPRVTLYFTFLSTCHHLSHLFFLSIVNLQCILLIKIVWLSSVLTVTFTILYHTDNEKLIGKLEIGSFLWTKLGSICGIWQIVSIGFWVNDCFYWALHFGAELWLFDFLFVPLIWKKKKNWRHQDFLRS